MGVGEDLHLDVAAAFEVGLDEDLAVAEGAHGLGARGLQCGAQFVEAAHDAHAAPAAARGRLDQYRQVRLGDLAQGGDAHQFLGAGLGRHRLDRRRGRSDPDQAGVEDGTGEVGVLGEEAVSGVHGVRAGAHGGLHHQVGAEVGVGGCRARQPYGGVGHARVERVLVGVRVHGDGPDAEFGAGAEDPAGDLAAVGDQQGRNHVIPHIRKTPKPPRAPS
ncbi:hypothetical protein GCM10011578_042000 [Streptomyces fuscichromogenes]|uniref:Uncharacterized protein n=1 Tax=Streptomyces fuscichromogenes TaxID=1324013 RepID=A0A918CSJ1_9ACTN|nr:hypothetical protein GCM10011578_042000 [Streptomyces fuscichromogenes]